MAPRSARRRPCWPPTHLVAAVSFSHGVQGGFGGLVARARHTDLQLARDGRRCSVSTAAGSRSRRPERARPNLWLSQPCNPQVSGLIFPADDTPDNPERLLWNAGVYLGNRRGCLVIPPHPGWRGLGRRPTILRPILAVISAGVLVHSLSKPEDWRYAVAMSCF